MRWSARFAMVALLAIGAACLDSGSVSDSTEPPPPPPPDPPPADTFQVNFDWQLVASDSFPLIAVVSGSRVLLAGTAGLITCCPDTIRAIVARTDSTLDIELRPAPSVAAVVYTYNYVLDMGPLNAGHYEVTMRFITGYLPDPISYSRTLSMDIPGDP